MSLIFNSEMLSNKKFNKVSEVHLTYRNKQKASERPKVSSSLEAYSILKESWSDQIALCEEFNVLLLDRSNKVMAFCQLFKGGISATVVDLKIVFATALKARASSMIIAHNHPSGNLKPSTQDVSLTRKFKQAAELLEIKLLDHLILSPDDNYYSFADNGNVL